MDLKDYIIDGAYVFLCSLIFNKVNDKVTVPFIDEIFHIPQCQTYCKYDFYSWDNKITTPPGLYILGFLYSKIVLVLFGTTLGDICSQFSMLRSLNLIGGVVVLPLIVLLLKKRSFSPLVISTLPILSTYYYLFYTDVWATIFVVQAIVLVSEEPFGFLWSNVLCAVDLWVSLWFRQTNILWVIFVAAFAIEKQLRKKKSTSVDRKTTLNINFVLSYILEFITVCLSSKLVLSAYAIVIASFASFVVWNKGITLGDKENHQLNLHVVQVFYCFTFVTFFTWPVWLSKKLIVGYFRDTFGSARNAICNAFIFFAIKYIIDNFTVVHPFLLADNRHYTFYIWRRLLSHPYSFVVAVPVYHFSAYVLGKTLIGNLTTIWRVKSGTSSSSSDQQEDEQSLRMGPILIIGYFAVTCATIIPSPLFEPRYYILPLVVYRLFANPLPRNDQHFFNGNLVEVIWYVSVNTLVMGVFLNYEFKWDTEMASQRIIW